MLELLAQAREEAQRLAGQAQSGFKAVANLSPEDIANYIRLQELQTATSSEKYAGIKEIAIAQNPDTAAFFEQIEGLESQPLQDALGNALVHNAHFRDYVQKHLGADGTDGGLAGLMQDLQPEAIGPITDILNTIANNPDVNPSTSIDRIIDTTTELNRLKESGASAKEISTATLAMLDAIQDAGGQVPALARLQGMNADMLMQFLSDMTMPGGGTEFAITNLAGALGIEGEALVAFQESIEPFAGMIEFMVEPYAELYHDHGNSFAAIGQTWQGRYDTFATTEPVVFHENADRHTPTPGQPEAPTPDPITSSFTAAGNMTREQIEEAAQLAAANEQQYRQASGMSLGQ